jgi:predicted nucleic acid-binding protein
MVRLLLEEPGTEAADADIFHDPRWIALIAPSILVSETAAAITKKLRRKEIRQEAAMEAFRDWQAIQGDRVFTIFPANDLVDVAFALSLRLHHPLHDCIYLALAQAQEAAIATSDGVLARKARELGIATEFVAA